MNTTLFDLQEEYRQLLDVAMSDDDPQAFLDTLEPLLDEVAIKGDGYAAVIDRLNARAELYKQEAKRLTEAAKRYTDRAAQMKERFKNAMIEMDQTRLETQYHVFSVRKNGGKQAMEITGEVPDSYKRVVYEDDMDKIRAALDRGEVLEFARLKPRGTHLSID